MVEGTGYSVAQRTIASQEDKPHAYQADAEV